MFIGNELAGLKYALIKGDGQSHYHLFEAIHTLYSMTVLFNKFKEVKKLQKKVYADYKKSIHYFTSKFLPAMLRKVSSSTKENDKTHAIISYLLFILFENNRKDKKIHKLAVDYLRNNHFDLLPVECFGWLLPIIAALPGESELQESVLHYLQMIVNVTENNGKKCGTFNCYYPNSFDSLELFHHRIRSDAVLLNGLLMLSPQLRSLCTPLIECLVNTLNSFISRSFISQSTQATCWVIVALDNYFNNFHNAPDTPIQASLWINDVFVREVELQKDSAPISPSLSIPFYYLNKKLQNNEEEIENHANNYQITLLKQGNGAAFYKVSFNYLSDKFRDVPALESRGITLKRSYFVFTDSGRKEMNLSEEQSFSVNKNVRVLVSISIQIYSRANHFSLTDYFPAGFQCENPLLKPLPAGFNLFSSALSQKASDSSNNDALSADSLPNEILCEIFNHLDAHDLLLASRVSKRWNYLCSADHFWSNLDRVYSQRKRAHNYTVELWMSEKDKFLIKWKFVEAHMLKNQLTARFNSLPPVTQWFSHQNIRLDQVECQAEILEPGCYTYEYIIRSFKSGTYIIPPTRASLLYKPDICANTTNANVTVN